MCCFLLPVCVNSSGQSSARLSEALQALRNGNSASAERVLREASDANPRNPEILNDLGIAYQVQNKSEQAIRTFEKVLALKRIPSAVAMLAEDYCRDHEFQRALPLLHEVKAYLSDLNIDAIVGPCLLESELPEYAVPAFENLAKAGYQPQDENEVNLIRAYLDLSRKLFTSITTLPGGAIYSRAVERAKADGSLNPSSVVAEAQEQAPYFKESASLREGIRLLSAHQKDAAFLFLLGTRCAEAAAERFQQAEDRWPDSIALQQLTAELKDLNKDREGAIETYEAILASHPEAPPAVHFALGLLYAERQRWDDALEQYRSIQKEAEGSLYLKQRISDALLHLGRNQEVMQLLDGVVHSPRTPTWALRDYGEAAEGLGQKQIALAFLQRASKKDPENFPLHYHLLHVYHDLRMAAAANAELAIVKQESERAASGAANSEKTHRDAAERFERTHQLASAEAEWRAILTVDPNSNEAIDGLSSDLMAEDKYLDVISLLENAQVARDRTPHQVANLGAAYARSGKVDTAISVLRDGFNTSPDSLFLAEALGDTLIRAGKYADATAVLRFSYDRPDATLKTKVMYLKALIEVDYESSAPLAHSLLEGAPGDWEVQCLNGVLDMKLGDLPHARNHLKQAIANNPSAAACHAELALVLAREGNLVEAAREQQRAVALKDPSWEIAETLGKVQETIGSEQISRRSGGTSR